jgi:DNA-binding winged helix-turn-helix (wHTH) protein/tetratricopeptide (TPR) repeat protein
LKIGVRGTEVTNVRRKPDEDGPSTASPGEGAAAPRLRRLAFGRFVLDEQTGRLLDGGTLVALAPKPFETLLYLATQAGRVVPKAELIDRLWPGVSVTDDVLVQCIVDIRRALGDSPRTPDFIETVPRRGYQFLAAVRPVVEARETPGRSRARLPRWFPRSLASPGTWAGLTLALAVAAGGWALYDRPAPEAPPSVAALTRPGLLLVLPIEVHAPAENAWLRQGLAELLRSELGQRPGVHPVGRHQMAEALHAAGFDDDRVPPTPAALGIARRLGAERMVTGSLVQIDDRFRLSTHLVQVASGRSEEIAEGGRYPGELLDVVQEVSLAVADRLSPGGGSEAGASAARPIRLATRSVEAYRHYAEALSWFARGGREGAVQAESHLDEAVRLDPDFAYAHLKKAEIQQWRRRLGYGEPDPVPAIREAARVSGQLPERERLLVEILEAQLVRADTAGALSRGATLLRLSPTFAEEMGVPRMMAEIDYSEGRWDDLIGVGQAHVDSPSMPGPERALLSALLAKAYRQKGETDRALSCARRAVRLWPGAEGPSRLRQRTDLGRICLDAGRQEEALAEFRAVAAAVDADVTNLTDAAWGLYMGGLRSEAEALAERALARDPGYGNAHHLRGWLQLGRGEYAAAAASFERAFDLTPTTFGAAHLGFLHGDLAALYYTGVAYQKAGRRDRAESAFRHVMRICRDFQASRAGAPRTLADWEAASFLPIAAARLGEVVREPPRLRGDDATFFLQSARLHAAQGRREQSLRELAHALALTPGERQHVADDPNFDALRDLPEFRRLLEAAARD